jgi:hypothetical protein
VSAPRTPLKSLLPAACAALALSAPVHAAAGDDRAPAAGRQGSSLPALTAEQRQAIGIIVSTVPSATLSQHVDAYGRVLDPSQLVGDAGRLAASRAAAGAAAAETGRLEGLYHRANTSLKALQLAQAAQAQAQARLRQAQAEFLLRWAPLARLDGAQRARLIEDLAAGRQLLLRAELPGRHSLGTLPTGALVDVDGVMVPTRILGVVSATAAGMQSVGLLLQMTHPPAGLGPGAQLPVTFEGRDRNGHVVPDGALIYGARGAYVYRVLPDGSKGELRFAPLRVQLLQPAGGGWLVTGLHADDRIVVRGAGALWSLQGLSIISGDDD